MATAFSAEMGAKQNRRFVAGSGAAAFGIRIARADIQRDWRKV
jgi:hypothetical protein